MTMNDSEANRQGNRRATILIDAFFRSWITPGRAAERLGALSLPRVFAVHLVSSVAVVAVIFILLAMNAANTIELPRVAVELERLLGSIANDWARNPLESSLMVIAIAVGIELAFVSFAHGVMPWGARDERLRDSYKHALRQTWLRTPHILVIVFVMGSGLLANDLARRGWATPPIPAAMLPKRPQAPPVTEDSEAYRQAWAQYQIDLDNYNKEFSRVRAAWRLHHRADQPWYLDDPELIFLPLGALLVLWFFWAYLRAVGIERNVPPVERPPMCESCGYNLTTMSMDARCPECGRPVIESLGPQARLGPAWARRNQNDKPVSWWSTTKQAIRAPSKFGAQLRTTSHETAHRASMLRALPFVFVVGAAALFMLYYITIDPDFASNDLLIAIILFGLFGSACVLGTVGCALNNASTVGLFLSWRCRRNMLPAAMQAASYLSGYLLLWSIFGAASGLIVIQLDRADAFRALQEMTGIYRDLIATLTWLIPNGACSLGYLLLVGRMAGAARYANR